MGIEFINTAVAVKVDKNGKVRRLTPEEEQERQRQIDKIRGYRVPQNRVDNEQGNIPQNSSFCAEG